MSMRQGIRALAGQSRSVSKAVSADTLSAAGYCAGGIESSESAARELSTVDRCIEILSDSMAELPAYIMDRSSRERLEIPPLQLLNVRPNEAMTPFVRKKVLETSRLVHGNGYDWILRDERTGKITGFIPVPGYLVEPWRDLTGTVWYTVTHPWTGEPMVLPG